MRPFVVEYQFEFNLRWNHDGKQTVCSWVKLDLPDEVIVGVGQMRIADDIVCYSIAISQRPDCVKSNDQCMWKRHVLDHGVTLAVSDAKH